MRSAEEFESVRRLIKAGVNDCAISRLTGMPRPTVRDWRCRPPAQLRLPAASSTCGVDHDFSALPAAPYCYLLGMYLGDGCSDGCRVVANDRGVKSIRYHLPNMSEDIHGLFTAAL